MAAKKAPAETITAAQLAELVGRDPKQVRAMLRKEFARDPEQKGARWTITQSIRDKVVSHFEALNANKEAKAS